jgi:hypothetical protein
MEVPVEKLLTVQELEETKAKLLKIGPEGSKVREIAFYFMQVATAANRARFEHKDQFDKWASYDGFLSQLQAVRDRYRFTNARINSGIEWLKEQGFDYTYGHLDVNFVAQDAIQAINERERYRKEQEEKAKNGNKANNGQKQKWDGC